MAANAWGLIGCLLAGVLRYQAFFSVFILVGFIVATNYMQRKALDRATDVMRCCADAVKNTRVYEDAQRYFDRRSPEFITRIAQARQETPKSRRWQWLSDAVHLHFPPAVLVGITLFFSILAAFGAQYSQVTDTPSYILGGKTAILPGMPSADQLQELRLYQSATLFMLSVTFLMAYIRTISKLIQRINNNDIRPISYYFLSLGMLTSMLVALVTRHLVPLIDHLDKGATPEVLAALAFLIGWKPSLWLQDLGDRISKFLKVTILTARAPDKNNLPLDMDLAMIQGLTGDNADRLEEIGVVNCQDLAERNAIVLWLRTPFTLELVCDWISQAQLCLHYNDNRLKLLAEIGVRDICGYMKALSKPEGVDALVSVLNAASAAVPISKAILDAQKIAIEEKPSYQQLVELHQAMIPAIDIGDG